VLHKFLEQRLREAVAAVLPDADTGAVLVRPCPEPRFGDYQANALMALAKARKINPRQLAADVAVRLDVAEWCEPVEIAGAGFLNFRLKIPALARALESVARGGEFLSASMSNMGRRRQDRVQELLLSKPQIEDLTPAERRILKLIGEDHTSKEIADRLQLSIKTIENHRLNICHKLNLHGSHSLLKFAFEHKSRL